MPKMTLYDPHTALAWWGSLEVKHLLFYVVFSFFFRCVIGPFYIKDLSIDIACCRARSSWLITEKYDALAPSGRGRTFVG